jgi:hypothetical protein
MFNNYAKMMAPPSSWFKFFRQFMFNNYAKMMAPPSSWLLLNCNFYEQWLNGQCLIVHAVLTCFRHQFRKFSNGDACTKCQFLQLIDMCFSKLLIA